MLQIKEKVFLSHCNKLRHVSNKLRIHLRLLPKIIRIFHCILAVNLVLLLNSNVGFFQDMCLNKVCLTNTFF